VNDLLNHYGNDILKKWNKTIKLYVTNVEDGKIYNVAGMSDFPYSGGMFIRQDWLTKLGLKSPVTIDEYIKVLKAFRDNDPNGNGKADEIPLTLHGSENLSYWFWAYGILTESPHQLSGSFTSDIYEIIDNKLVPFFYNKHYEEALDNLARLYKEKLLDREYLVRDSKSTQELAVNSISGAGYGYGQVRSYTENLRKTSNPTGYFAWSAVPKGPYGDQHIAARSPISSGALITIKAKNPEKLMQFLNWYYTNEGILINNYGEEGKHYKLVDGKPDLLEPYCLGFTDNRKAGLTANDGYFCWVGDAFLQCAMNGKGEKELDEYGKLTYDSYVLNEPFAYNFPKLPSIYNSELNIKKTPDIWVPIFNLQNQIIMGEKTYADMKALLAKLQNDITELTNAANKTFAIMNSGK
jgi:hypothetical protein